MSLITLGASLIAVGVLLWWFNNYVSIHGKIRKIINFTVVFCVIVWLLYAFGVLNHAGDLPAS